MATINIAGTYYAFTVSAATATTGATYTNNGFTYTVRGTIASGTTLYTTAAAAGNNPLTSGTLTKTSGVGDATITFSAYALDARLADVTYVAGDIMNVSANQRLIINESTTSKKTGTLQCFSGTGGNILITNSSTTTPIVVEMNTINDDIIVQNDSTLKISGNWIEIYTGSGAAFQTIDFTTAVGGVSIDYPPFVMVETGAATNVWEPFLNCAKGTYDFTVSGVVVTPTIGATYTNNGITFRVWRTNITAGSGTIFCTATTGVPVVGNLVKTAGTGDATIAFSAFTAPNTGAVDIATQVGSGFDLGRFFNFDNTTRVAIFGDGTNGAVIPSGARVRYPNIHMTSAKTATILNRSLITTNSGGNLDFNCCAWSNAWTLKESSMYAQGTQRLVDVGCTTWISNYVQGSCTINGLYMGLDTDAIGFAATFSLVLGDLSLNNIYAATNARNTAAAINIGASANLTSCGNFRAYLFNPTNNNRNAVAIQNITVNSDNLVLTPMFCAGGSLFLLNTKNLHVFDYSHSDTVSGVVTALLPTQVINLQSGCSNIVVRRVRKISGGSGPNSHLVQTNLGVDRCAFHDIVYDGNSNLATLGAPSGERIWLTNVFSATAPRSFSIQGNLFSRFKSRISNVTHGGASVGGSPIIMGAFPEFLESASMVTTSNAAFDIPPIVTGVLNAALTSGTLQIGPFGPTALSNHYRVVSGVFGVDYSFSDVGYINIPGAGVEIEVYNDFQFPIRGITSFASATMTAFGTSPTTGVTYEFKMRKARDRAYTGGWITLSAADVQTTLTGLSGYSNLVGFQMIVRITTQTAVANRQLQRISFTSTTFNPSFTPSEVGFIEVGVSGAVVGSNLSVFDNTTPATPVWIEYGAIPATGSYLTDFPYNFDATAANYLMRLRKYEYEPFEQAGTCFQRGANVVVSQQLAKVVASAAVAAAYTGISINFLTETITVTANRSIQELYDYCRFQLALIDNLDYPVFISSTDGINFTCTYNLTINNCTLSGSANISMPTKTLSVIGSGLTVPVITYNAGTRVNLTLTGLVPNSRVQLYDVTAATELYNEVVAGTSVSVPYVWTVNRSIRYRVMYVSGTTAYKWVEANGTVTNTGMNVTINQELDPIYNGIAIDGSTVTECTIVGTTLVINVDDPDNRTTAQRLLAFEIYWLYTAGGIRDQNLYIEYPDATHLIFQGGLKIKNLDTSNPLSISGASIVPETGNPSDVIDSSGGSININTDRVITFTDPTKYLTTTKFLGLKD